MTVPGRLRFMKSHRLTGHTRREFLTKTVSGAAAVASGAGLLQAADRGPGNAPEISLVLDGSASVCSRPPVRWAVEQLRDTLTTRGLAVEIVEWNSLGARASLPASTLRGECILVTGSGSTIGRQALKSAGVSFPETPEALGLLRTKLDTRPLLLACGSDERGLVYGLLELADQVSFAEDAVALLRNVEPTVEQPANTIRSVARCFVSDVEDKAWFYDRAFWQRYLSMLATHRFNRFSLTLGIGYDFTTDIRDCYFHFAYPFLVSVPGYKVRAFPLPAEERDANFEMLKSFQHSGIRSLEFT